MATMRRMALENGRHVGTEADLFAWRGEKRRRYIEFKLQQEGSVELLFGGKLGKFYFEQYVTITTIEEFNANVEANDLTNWKLLNVPF